MITQTPQVQFRNFENFAPCVSKEEWIQRSGADPGGMQGLIPRTHETAGKSGGTAGKCRETAGKSAGMAGKGATAGKCGRTAGKCGSQLVLAAAPRLFAQMGKRSSQLHQLGVLTELHTSGFAGVRVLSRRAVCDSTSAPHSTSVRNRVNQQPCWNPRPQEPLPPGTPEPWNPKPLQPPTWNPHPWFP